MQCLLHVGCEICQQIHYELCMTWHHDLWTFLRAVMCKMPDLCDIKFCRCHRASRFITVQVVISGGLNVNHQYAKAQLSYSYKISAR